MITLTDTEKFLQAVFPDYREHAVFAHSLASGGMAHTRDVEDLPGGRDCYWCIAAFPDDGSTVRTLARALDVRALVIDDVGTKVDAWAVDLALGAPTAEIETSAGNFQFVYRLAQPIPVDQWAGFFAEIERRVGYKLEGRDAVHLFRLPAGVNNKPGRGGHVIQLPQLNPGITLSGVVFNPGNKTTAGPEPSGSLGLEALRKLMRMIPNDLDRDGWIEVGHGLKALCENDDEGFEVFDEWSQLHDSYDAAETRRVWDSLGTSGLRTKGGQLRARAEGLEPEGFRQWEAAAVFDDDPPEVVPGLKSSITATPFKWMDLAKTSPRDWLYGDILLRKFISMTVAPGGTGKSTLIAVETLAQVTGKSLLGDDPSGELRVWLWNLEDTYEETQKKILAAAKHYGIGESEIGDRLFVDSGRDQRLVVAEMDHNVPRIVRPVIGALVEQIKLRRIDVVVIDPFVSCHGVPENDNTAQDMVVKEWGRVAEEGNCAVHLVDHTSKAGSKEVVTTSSRGAMAKTDAARVVRVVNRMTDIDGRTFGITDIWRYFNTFNDKANMAPPKVRRDWFRMESVWAGNGGGAGQAFSAGAAAVPSQGDSIGVAVQWTPPSAKIMAAGDAYTKVIAAMGTKRWRTAPRSPDWIGNAIAQGLQIDAPSISGKASINAILKTWISEGLLKVSEQMDERRRMKEYIEIAQVY